jgi:hypothetical protein
MNAPVALIVVCDCPCAGNGDGAGALCSRLSLWRSLPSRQGRSRVDPRIALPASDAGWCRCRRETPRVRPARPRMRSGGESRGLPRPRSRGSRHPQQPPRTPSVLVRPRSPPTSRHRPSVSTGARSAIREDALGEGGKAAVEPRDFPHRPSVPSHHLTPRDVPRETRASPGTGRSSAVAMRAPVPAGGGKRELAAADDPTPLIPPRLAAGLRRETVQPATARRYSRVGGG